MEIVNCTKVDFDQILSNFEMYWGDDSSERLKKLRALHHPMMLYELGDNAFVIKDNGVVVAYLFGLFSKIEPLAYVHFISTHRDYKRKGLATLLYNSFIEKAKQHGCIFIKATTSPGNEASMKFHASIGMELLGKPNNEGIPVVADYAGHGEDRVVFLKHIR